MTLVGESAGRGRLIPREGSKMEKKMELKEIWVIECHGLQGCRRFETEEAARKEADFLRTIAGQPWTPKKILGFVDKK